MQLAAPRPSAHINVTPVIDVMLVLLIIFMVVVPVIALQVDLPVAINPQSKPEEPAVTLQRGRSKLRSFYEP